MNAMAANLTSAELENVRPVADGVVVGYCFHRRVRYVRGEWAACENCGSFWDAAFAPQPLQILRAVDELPGPA